MNSDLEATLHRRASLPFSRHLAPVALIVAIAIAGLGFLITHPDGLFNRHSDLLAFHLGTQTVLYDAWRAGHVFPLWRSDIFSGAPAFANPQSMYTHPVHLLFLLDRPERVVGLVIWLQMLLGALGGYCAGTVLRLSVPGRVLVAVTLLFSFKTILAVYAGWLTMVSAMAAMPLLFAATAVTLERPTVRSALLFSGAGALLLHSGHPQFQYYAGLFVTMWALVRIGRDILAGYQQRAARVAGALALGGAIAIGLSAYVLAPIAYNAALVTRWNTSYELFIGSRPLVPAGLLTIFSPEIFGTPHDGSFVQAWETIVYFGAMTSLLVIPAVLQGRNRPYALTLLLGALFCVALGVHTPLTYLAYKVVPGLHVFRQPERILFVGTFFVCCLAGIGFDIVVSAARGVRSRQLVAAAIIGLVVLEGSFWARRYLRIPEAAPYAVSDAYVASVVGNDPAVRVAPLSRSLPNYGAASALGLQLVTGYDPFNLAHYQTFIELLQYGREVDHEKIGEYWQPNWTDIRQVARFDMLAALNVSYLVSPAALAVPDDEYNLIHSFHDQAQFHFYEGLTAGPVYVYRNQRPLDRAFFVAEVVAAGNEKAAISEVLRNDLRRTAVVIGSQSNRSSIATVDDRVEVARSVGGQLDLSTRNTNIRFLVISEVWLPGWSARVDGHPAELSRVDIALQGLWLTPGEHRVELRYWPPGLTGGLIISGLTAGSVIGLVAFSLGRRRYGRRRVSCATEGLSCA